MTAEERLDHLVALAVTAVEFYRPVTEAMRGALRERLAQGVQAWALEVDTDISEARDTALASAARYAEDEAHGRWRGGTNQAALLAVAEGIRGLR